MMIDVPFISVPEMIAIHARTRPGQIAWIDDRGPLDQACLDWACLDWAGLDAAIERAVGDLLRLGLHKHGDPIALLADSTAWTWINAFAIMRANGVVAPLNSMLRAATLAAMISDSGAKVLFVGAGYQDLAAETLACLAEDEKPFVISEAAPGTGAPPGNRLGTEPGAAPPADRVPIARGDAINLIYSSGATGIPKGIVHSHQARAHFAALTASMMVFRASARTLITTPPHTNGSWIMILPTIYVGGTVITSPGFSAGKFLDQMARHRPTNVLLVPTMLRAIMSHPDVGSADWTCFDFIITGGSHTPPEEKLKIMEMTGDRLGELWGFTEGVLTVVQPHEMRQRLESAGRPAPENDVRVIDAEGNEVPFGVVGELVGRSTHFMTGYHNRPEATDEMRWMSPDSVEYLRTGDLGTLDRDGWVTIRGRMKDMIKSGGLNVFPADIEPVLMTHRDVAECSVVGVPHPKWGETPVAFVVPADGAAATPASIMSWLNDRVEKTQRVRDLVLLPELPRNSIGKVTKHLLQEMYGDKFRDAAPA